MIWWEANIMKSLLEKKGKLYFYLWGSHPDKMCLFEKFKLLIFQIATESVCKTFNGIQSASLY